jgi:tetratricopeptide (TPR) repeat protein
MRYGQKAIDHLERGIHNRNDVIELYRLANLYYQMGRIQATGLSNDNEAISWFTTAIPLFQQVEPHLDDYEQPRLGEIYVSIGVSYWNIGEKEYALKISEYGIEKLVEAVEQKIVPEKILSIPYENLSAMYEKTGHKEKAENYYILSKSVSGGGTGSSVK